MPQTALTPEHVIRAYRLLMDREPENKEVVLEKVRGHANTETLRADFMSSEEFRTKNPYADSPREAPVVIKELASGVRIFLDLSDHVIDLAILRGVYEPNELAFVCHTLAPGDTVIDVGAHIGFFSLELASRVGPEGRVYAFEPSPPNADLLERSIRENRFSERLVLERVAVGQETGEAVLVHARETPNSGGSYLVDGLPEVPTGHLSTRVRTITLDGYQVCGPVKLVKLDAEGAEPLVIRGARELLARDRPVILCEIHRQQLQRVAACSAERFVQEMQDLGYECHEIASGRLGDVVAASVLRDVSNVVFQPR